MLGAESAASGPRYAGLDHHWLTPERLRLYALVALLCHALYFGIWTVRAWVLKVPGVFPPGGDFMVFWSAAHIALSGDPVAVYDFASLRQVEAAAVPQFAAVNGVLPWLYPPTFLLFVTPLGLLPYWLAVPVFLCAGASVYLWVASRILPWRKAWLLCAAFPGIGVALAAGQNSLLLAACGAFALSRLRERPLIAGALLGLLTIKPHLALVFPIALACAGSWKALASMAVTALALAVLALAAFGAAPFAAFAHNAGLARAALETGQGVLARMPTVFAMVKLAGGPAALAYALQALVAAAALAVVVWAWRRPCAMELRAAAVLVATLLVSPYLYDYDLALLGPALAWLAMVGCRTGWKPMERELLVLLWLLPLGGPLIAEWLGFQPMPVLLVFALLHIARGIACERTGMTLAAVERGRGEGEP